MRGELDEERRETGRRERWNGERALRRLGGGLLEIGTRRPRLRLASASASASGLAFPLFADRCPAVLAHRHPRCRLDCSPSLSRACCHSHNFCRCCVSMGYPHIRSCACALAPALDAYRCMSDTEKLTVRVDGRARPARMRIGRQAFSPVAAFVRVPVSSNFRFLLLLVHGACF